MTVARNPERDRSQLPAPQTEAQQEIHRIHRQIGTAGYKFLIGFGLGLVKEGGPDFLQQPVFVRALSDFKGYLEENWISGYSEGLSIDDLIGKIFQNPSFTTTFGAMQKIAAALLPNIEKGEPFVFRGNAVSLAGYEFDKDAVMNKFGGDLRGLDLFEYTKEEFAKRCPQDKDGWHRKLGAVFGYFLLRQEMLRNTYPVLDRLIALREKVG